MLRSYQERAIEDLRSSYRSGHRAPCLVLPTGGGKTVVAAAIVRGAVERGGRVMFLCHRRELIGQSVAKLRAVGLHDLRVIQASSDLGRPDAPVAVASIPTLANRRKPDADLVIIDEAHHTAARTWSELAAHYAGARLLGLTATPERADGAALGDIFDDLVVGASVAELTELGHLVRCQVWAPPQELGTAEVTVSPADAYDRHARGERAVVFCSSARHCADVAAELEARGIAAGVVSGSMPAGARTDVLARFRAGELRALVCVHVLTEGWDDPGVSVCILARKPGHAGTYLQMAGRVLRPHPGKERAVVLDLCGSSLKHGTPAMEREYSLEGRAISRVERMAIRQCLECGTVYELADACPTCGFAAPARRARDLLAVGGGLVAIDPWKPPPRPFDVPITARFPGTCSRCRNRYAPGTPIYWAKGRQVHRHQECA